MPEQHAHHRRGGADCVANGVLRSPTMACGDAAGDYLDGHAGAAIAVMKCLADASAGGMGSLRVRTVSRPSWPKRCSPALADAHCAGGMVHGEKRRAGQAQLPIQRQLRHRGIHPGRAARTIIPRPATTRTSRISSGDGTRKGQPTTVPPKMLRVRRVGRLTAFSNELTDKIRQTIVAIMPYQHKARKCRG